MLLLWPCIYSNYTLWSQICLPWVNLNEYDKSFWERCQLNYMFTNSSCSSLQLAKITSSRINAKNLEENSSLSKWKLQSIKFRWSERCAGHTGGGRPVLPKNPMAPSSGGSEKGPRVGTPCALDLPCTNRQQRQQRKETKAAEWHLGQKNEMHLQPGTQRPRFFLWPGSQRNGWGLQWTFAALIKGAGRNHTRRITKANADKCEHRSNLFYHHQLPASEQGSLSRVWISFPRKGHLPTWALTWGAELPIIQRKATETKPPGRGRLSSPSAAVRNTHDISVQGSEGPQTAPRAKQGDA